MLIQQHRSQEEERETEEPSAAVELAQQPVEDEHDPDHAYAYVEGLLDAHSLEEGSDKWAHREHGQLEGTEDEAEMPDLEAFADSFPRIEGSLHGGAQGVAEVHHHEGDDDQQLLTGVVQHSTIEGEVDLDLEL